MRKVSVKLSDLEYALFERAAHARQRSTNQLIQQAITAYDVEKLDTRSRLTDLPTLTARTPLGELPSRAEIYDEIFASDRGDLR